MPNALLTLTLIHGDVRTYSALSIVWRVARLSYDPLMTQRAANGVLPQLGQRQPNVPFEWLLANVPTVSGAWNHRLRRARATNRQR